MGHILLSRQIGGCAFISGVKMGVSPAVLEIEARHGLLDLGSSCHRTIQARLREEPAALGTRAVLVKAGAGQLSVIV